MKITRDFNSMTDRYAFDTGQCSTRNGFAQVDTSQDASYYGTWANPFKLIIVNYLEGDIIIKEAGTQKEFTEEIFKIKKWNEESDYYFRGIDPGFNKELKAKFQLLGLQELLH